MPLLHRAAFITAHWFPYYAQALYAPQYRVVFITTRWFYTMLGALYVPLHRVVFITALGFVPCAPAPCALRYRAAFITTRWFRTPNAKVNHFRFSSKAFLLFLSYPADFLGKDK